MIKKLWNIFLNANRSIYLKENNKINYTEVSIVYSLIVIASGFLVYYKDAKFIEDSKVLAMLLSLFSGLMYSVLLKIPDKLGKLESVSEEGVTNVKEFKKRIIENNLKNQTFNYLKNFSYTLSYAILVAIFCIILVIISTFFPSCLDFELSHVGFTIKYAEFDLWLTFKTIVIVGYRFSFVFFMLQFLYFILKAVVYLTEFTQYEFESIK